MGITFNGGTVLSSPFMPWLMAGPRTLAVAVHSPNFNVDRTTAGGSLVPGLRAVAEGVGDRLDNGHRAWLGSCIESLSAMESSDSFDETDARLYLATAADILKSIEINPDEWALVTSSLWSSPLQKGLPAGASISPYEVEDVIRIAHSGEALTRPDSANEPLLYALMSRGLIEVMPADSVRPLMKEVGALRQEEKALQHEIAKGSKLPRLERSMAVVQRRLEEVRPLVKGYHQYPDWYLRSTEKVDKVLSDSAAEVKRSLDRWDSIYRRLKKYYDWERAVRASAVLAPIAQGANMDGAGEKALVYRWWWMHRKGLSRHYSWVHVSFANALAPIAHRENMDRAGEKALIRRWLRMNNGMGGNFDMKKRVSFANALTPVAHEAHMNEAGEEALIRRWWRIYRRLKDSAPWERVSLANALTPVAHREDMDRAGENALTNRWCRIYNGMGGKNFKNIERTNFANALTPVAHEADMDEAGEKALTKLWWNIYRRTDDNNADVAVSNLLLRLAYRRGISGNDAGKLYGMYKLFYRRLKDARGGMPVLASGLLLAQLLENRAAQMRDLLPDVNIAEVDTSSNQSGGLHLRGADDALGLGVSIGLATGSLSLGLLSYLLFDDDHSKYQY